MEAVRSRALAAVNSRDFQDRLARRARPAGVTLPPLLEIKLEAYYRLLAIWNRKINLTGMDLSEASDDALDRLLIEPVVAARHAVPGVRIIDIGSGGGSPAIPFMLAVPGRSLRMVESKTRKSAFLKEASRVLEMRETEVITSRFESLLTDPSLHESHELLTLRAVRAEAKDLMRLQAFMKPGGQMFLFRSEGEAPGPLSPPLTRVATFPLVESTKSHVVVIEKGH